jgi:hypothetical protein
MEYAAETASCGTAYIPSLMKIGIGVQKILRICLRNMRGCNAGNTDGRDLCRKALRWLQVMLVLY